MQPCCLDIYRESSGDDHSYFVVGCYELHEAQEGQDGGKKASTDKEEREGLYRSSSAANPPTFERHSTPARRLSQHGHSPYRDGSLIVFSFSNNKL